VNHGVLFDLEGTLVDTTLIAPLRDARKWRESVQSMSRTRLYPGVAELLDQLEKHRIRWAVVTNVVSVYAAAALRHHRLHAAQLVAYHDVRRPKPDPEGCVKALVGLNIAASDAVGVGDTQIDREAFQRAGIQAYCAGWNAAADVDGDWTAILQTPEELLPLLKIRT
jgi:HAD superfamily hydrolase (TIGR01509 family)